MVLAIVIIILAIIAWLTVDLKLGARQKHENVSKKEPPLREGDVSFYSEGRTFFNNLFTAIDEAQDHIHMNFYIFRDDTIGKEAIQSLQRKARGGVEVRVLVDWLGSHGFPKKTRHSLEEAGIHFAAAQKPFFPYWFYTFNRRNHRKITVIDGKTGFLGGYNIGDEYLGKDPKFGDWRDYHLKIEGDGVQDLQKQFLADWQQATGDEVEGARYYPELSKGDSQFRLFPTDAAFLEEHFLDFINGAEKSVVLGSPYYIPGKKIQKALLAARKRDVSVKLILPMRKDHPLVHEAAVPYFAPLLRAGCEIFLFYQGFYHSKVMIIDEKMCDIGTANLDRRSFTFNNEINCFLYTDDLITTVLSALDRDFRRSEKLTLDSLKKRSFKDRVKEKTSSIFSPLL